MMRETLCCGGQCGRAQCPRPGALTWFWRENGLRDWGGGGQCSPCHGAGSRARPSAVSAQLQRGLVTHTRQDGRGARARRGRPLARVDSPELGPAAVSAGQRSHGGRGTRGATLSRCHAGHCTRVPCVRSRAPGSCCQGSPPISELVLS